MAKDKEKKQKEEPKEEKSKETKQKKEKNGVVNDYNKIGAKVLPHYYDREQTDAGVQKDFGDMFADLKQVNLKLKKELQTEKPAKLGLKEGTEKVRPEAYGYIDLDTIGPENKSFQAWLKKNSIKMKKVGAGGGEWDEYRYTGFMSSITAMVKKHFGEDEEFVEEYFVKAKR
jgi:hypothetical protein